MSTESSPQTLREALTALEPELRRALASRAGRTSSPSVATVSGQRENGEPFATIAPGTVTFFVASSGSTLFDRLRDAAGAQDAELLDVLTAHVAEGVTRAVHRAALDADSDEESEQIIDFNSVPTIGEFRYRGRLLGRGMFPTSDLEVVAERIFWTGGPLDDNEFTFVEYAREGAEPHLQALVVKSQPVLNAVESAVIDQIPAEQSDLHLRAIGPQAFPVAAAVAVAKGAAAAYRGTRIARAAAAALTLGTGCEGHLRALSPRELDELNNARDRITETYGEQDFAVSVEQLLDLRQELVARARRQ